MIYAIIIGLVLFPCSILAIFTCGHRGGASLAEPSE
jgi:hypothetical protein